MKFFLAPQMQNFLRQGGMQPPFINAYKFRLKGPEIKLFLLTRCKIFLGKSACKLQKLYRPTYNMYKFRFKRGPEKWSFF